MSRQRSEMVVAYSNAIALYGIDGAVIEVQADISAGLPGLTLTGLGDATVVQSRERIRSAIANSGISWPNRRITIALLPADVPKVGSRFDLAMAVAILTASGHIQQQKLADTAWLAELGLDGRLRPVRGVLPSVVVAHRAGLRRIVVAAENAAEAAIVPDIEVMGIDDLGMLTRWLRGESVLAPTAVSTSGQRPDNTDLVDVLGQGAAKRALEVSAAGGHHLYLLGTPGAGKTMLAQRLPALLPQLSDDQALEVSSVHSVAGALSAQAGLVRCPPFQAPHHTASVPALVGGGSGLAAPGAISLAHHGVLFLDEAPQFSPAALDALRQPLESGRVILHRSAGIVNYPARFLLVLAANPCPCGARATECECSSTVRRRYMQRLSGPLLDRIDIRVQVEPVPRGVLLDAHGGEAETSKEVAVRVALARATAEHRWAQIGVTCNAHVPGPYLREAHWRIPRAALSLAERFLDRGELTARGFERVLRLAWSAADLNGHDLPGSDDVGEALFLRMGWAAA